MLGYTRDEYVGHPIAGFHADQARIEDLLGRGRHRSMCPNPACR